MEQNLIKIWDGDFSIVKSKKNYDNAFANIVDENEMTIVINSNLVNLEDVIEKEDGWSLITFDTNLDFELTGFISKISSALADARISIFVVSSYSTDHILVKKENLDKTISILNDLEVEL